MIPPRGSIARRNQFLSLPYDRSIHLLWLKEVTERRRPCRRREPSRIPSRNIRHLQAALVEQPSPTASECTAQHLPSLDQEIVVGRRLKTGRPWIHILTSCEINGDRKLSPNPFGKFAMQLLVKRSWRFSRCFFPGRNHEGECQLLFLSMGDHPSPRPAPHDRLAGKASLNFFYLLKVAKRHPGRPPVINPERWHRHLPEQHLVQRHLHWPVERFLGKRGYEEIQFGKHSGMLNVPRANPPHLFLPDSSLPALRSTSWQRQTQETPPRDQSAKD